MILGIYCAGRFGKEIYDIAIRINYLEKRWDEIVFIDDVYPEKRFYGTDVYRPEHFLQNAKELEVIIANGTPINRKSIREKVKVLNFRLTSIIDPTSVVSPTAAIGEGVIITPFSTVSSDAVLHDNVLIQSYVRIGHDIEVGEDSVISSNVGIGGRTVVGSQTYIGMGAVIRDELHIGNNSIISMGAVIHTDVADGVTMVGLPARVSRLNETGIVFKHE